METTDKVTEGSPLKSAEDGTETVTTPSATELKKKSCKEVLGFSRMTHWRTAVFFLSLFLCLTVVFAFSFVIPCPERPQYNVTWNRDFAEAATYDFLAFEQANRDKVMDVLFVIKSTESSPNKSCANAGLPSPCLFMLALDGTKGRTLWERPLDAEFHWAQCGLQTGTRRSWHCLLSHSDNLTAIDKYTGDVVWQQPQPTGLRSSLPVLSVPDLDGDKVSDVVLVASDDTQTQLILLSGKKGTQIGSTVIIDSIGTNNHLLHYTKGGSYYVLLQRDSRVCGLALWKIAAKAKLEPVPGLNKDKDLENNASNTTGLVPIYLSEAGSLLRIKDSDDSSDLLAVSKRVVALVDGSTLKLRWRFNTIAIIGKPSFGHFNKDNILDLVVEDDVGNFTKRITILDGQTGGLLWESNLLASTNSPRPDAIHTINSFSVFMFWGLVPSESNSSEPLTSEQHSYMLHPSYPNVLLECTNVPDHIVTFKATLMELGRHAAYFLLKGPEKEGSEGTVVLTKRKLKQDVPSCNLIRISDEGALHSKEDLQEAFNRLRFSSDW
ncbi:protein FAM234A [Girardinichthys multiradiatus]|uniref:protein FAM234A n=1 Tax=Girardinichthys multiradiatus TaxID=208333 RepID=UPI001FAD6E98|nr:protein FAM234A [Girardinichthys multiradiatus]XP_047232223.1 protein FAM234A [Girardinichthys multiradiatus]XP_047232224.1 protein FAM234A [Girardinichthys multiradiatus]XP_047232225.1 protein FAM234A [Girardinichthys multiradiatus]